MARGLCGGGAMSDGKGIGVGKVERKRKKLKDILSEGAFEHDGSAPSYISFSGCTLVETGHCGGGVVGNGCWRCDVERAARSCKRKKERNVEKISNKALTLRE